MQRVYLGETEELEVKANTERYFYLENWSNSSFHIKLLTSENVSNIELKIASIQNSKILPKTEA